MNCKFLAEKFVLSFCNGDISGIESVLASKFNFIGPLFQFDSKDSYIDSLRGNLDSDPDAKILSIISEENEASIFYIYLGNTIGQLFKSRDGKIYETILVFDTNKVA